MADVEIIINGLPTVLAALDAVVTRLTALEAKVSALTDAVVALKARIDEDVAHLRDLLDQALATAADDQATIDALRAEADGVVASINAIDPVADFPAEPDPAPPVEPPVA